MELKTSGKVRKELYGHVNFDDPRKVMEKRNDMG